MEEMSQFEQRQLTVLNAIEAMMVKRIGDELSIAAPEREALYAKLAALHAEKVIKEIEGKQDSEIYALLIGGSYDGWTFEFGELREAARGRVSANADGVVSLPFQMSLVGNVTRNPKVISLTYYLTVDHFGKLMPAGIK